MIKKIKQNGILFTAGGVGVLGIIEYFDFSEPLEGALSIVAVIVMALPFPFYIKDWVIKK